MRKRHPLQLAARERTSLLERKKKKSGFLPGRFTTGGKKDRMESPLSCRRGKKYTGKENGKNRIRYFERGQGAGRAWGKSFQLRHLKKNAHTQEKKKKDHLMSGRNENEPGIT